MKDSPCLGVLRSVDLAPKQELADAIPDPCEVDSQVLATADQIPQLLLVRLRDAHETKLAGTEQAGQADRVTLVDFDVVGGVLEDVPGRTDDNIETSIASSPHQPIAGWSCLVDSSKRLRQSRQPLNYRLPWSASDSLRFDLSSRRVQHRGQRLLGVDVDSHPSHTFHGRRLLIHRCGYRPKVPPSTDTSPRETMREAPVFASPQASAGPYGLYEPTIGRVSSRGVAADQQAVNAISHRPPMNGLTRFRRHRYDGFQRFYRQPRPIGIRHGPLGRPNYHGLKTTCRATFSRQSRQSTARPASSRPALVSTGHNKIGATR